jgi:hypothetical protein
MSALRLVFAGFAGVMPDAGPNDELPIGPAPCWTPVGPVCPRSRFGRLPAGGAGLKGEIGTSPKESNCRRRVETGGRGADRPPAIPVVGLYVGGWKVSGVGGLTGLIEPGTFAPVKRLCVVIPGCKLPNGIKEDSG